MEIFDKYELKTLLNLMFFTIWGIIAIALIPLMVGLSSLGGFEKRPILEKFMFYSGPGGLFIEIGRAHV